MKRWKTVPVCIECWRIREGDRKPVRFIEPERETCEFCEGLTYSGIYVRAEVEVQ